MLSAAALMVLTAASPARELERLYLDLQFERCLTRAAAAAGLELDEQEHGEVALYRGLCRYGLGDVTQAARDFDEAILHAPALEMPRGTSPKIVAELDAARARARRAALEPKPPAPAPAPAPPAAVAVEPEPPRLRPLAWSLGGGAIVMSAVSMFLGTQAQGSAAAANEAHFAADADAFAQRARTFETWTNVGWTLAAAAALGAIAVWLFAR